MLCFKEKSLILHKDQSFPQNTRDMIKKSSNYKCSNIMEALYLWIFHLDQIKINFDREHPIDYCKKNNEILKEKFKLLEYRYPGSHKNDIFHFGPWEMLYFHENPSLLHEKPVFPKKY
jgi:hypothetical protein